MILDFFLGDVAFLKQGIIRATYRVKDSKCIIKVKNSTHVRCFDQVGMSGNWPEYFEIIAPMKAVKIVSGKMPDEYVLRRDRAFYLQRRMLWDNY